MDRRVVRAVVAAAALAVVVIGAGCSTLGPTGGAADRDAGHDGPSSAAVTPAPVPPDASRAAADSRRTGSDSNRGADHPVGDELAPGLTAAGVARPGRLAAAHAAALDGRSYTVRIGSVRRRDGGVVSQYNRTIAFADSPGRFHYVLDALRRGEERHVERFGDGDRVYRFVREANGTSASLVCGPEGPRDPTRQFPDRAMNQDAIRQLFGLANTTVTDRRVRDGATEYRVAVVGGETTVTPLRSLSIVSWVTDAGLVRSYHVDYTIVHDGDAIHVAVDVVYAEIGRTTVDRPAWVDAVARTTTDAERRLPGDLQR